MVIHITNSSLKCLNRKPFLQWILFVTLFAIIQTAFAEIDIVYDKDKLLKTLEGMPYSEEGPKNGPIMYYFGYSEDPYGQALYRDWNGKLGDIRIRRILYAVSPRSANETVYLGLSRDPKDYHAFMNGTKTAPQIRTNKKNTQIFNSIMTPITQIIGPILIKNGWPIKSGVVPSTYIWEAEGHLWAAGGYETKDYFQSVITSLREQKMPVYKKYKIISVKPEGLPGNSAGVAIAKKSSSTKNRPSAAGGIFSVQGITTGMTMKQIKRKLQSSGWKDVTGNSGQGWNIITRDKHKQIVIKYYKVGDNMEAGQITYNLSFNTPNFDSKKITQQILKKYGKPHYGTGRIFRYWEQPNGFTRKEMGLACREELIRKGMQAAPARGKAGIVTNVEEWVRSGDTTVKKICPGSYPEWKKYMARELGKFLDISVLRPRRGANGGIQMSLRESRIMYHYQRELMLKKEQARKAAPKATMDASDF